MISFLFPKVVVSWSKFENCCLDICRINAKAHIFFLLVYGVIKNEIVGGLEIFFSFPKVISSLIWFLKTIWFNALPKVVISYECKSLIFLSFFFISLLKCYGFVGGM
jgi:hypothetical protein